MDPNEPIDIPKLMLEIREKVAQEIALQGGKPMMRTFTADPGNRSQHKAGAVQYSEELTALNRLWDFANILRPQPIATHRKGIVGKIIVRFKQKLLSVIYEGLFRPYVDAQLQFQMKLVQLLNLIGRYTDDRDAATFWELNRKIDYDVSKTVERLNEYFDDAMGTLRSSEKDLNSRIHEIAHEINQRVTKLQALSEQQGNAVKTLDSVTRGLEGIVGRLKPADSEPFMSVITSAPDQTYLLLENRYRGSQAEIRERLSIYPEIFKGAKRPVVDIGAGRGELQLLMNEAGVPCYGIDLDHAMVEEAKAAGAKVLHGNGLTHLESLEDGALGGVVAIQVVEHLEKQTLTKLFELCRQKIASGGKVAFETINPQSLLALSSNYFRDPTHVFPLHPDTLAYALTLAGFVVEETRYLSPVPESAKLKSVEKDEYMTPRWAFAVDTMNQNIQQLNAIVYGHQDFAVIARVP